MKLTELAIKNLKPKAKSYRVTDGGGLSLEISPAGGKLWRWRYYYQGKEQILALGKYPALSLSEARRKRDEARDPAADLRDILPTPEEKHHACIHPSELPDLLAKIEARDKDFTQYAMKLLALTFVRTSELIGATWAEIDWAKEEWHIPKERMKMKRPHIVPLSHQTLAIFKELQALTGEKTHIFHSAASKSQHISNGTVLMGLRRMGYQNRMTGHGFRTLASTILNEKNYPSDWIERQLAHEEDDKIRGAYNRAEHLLERKKMMQEYADWLDGVLSEKDNKVLSLKASN